jgi:hypothetical protein
VHEERSTTNEEQKTTNNEQKINKCQSVRISALTCVVLTTNLHLFSLISRYGEYENFYRMLVGNSNMDAFKLVYDDLPPTVEMPKEIQHHSVQIIITPLEKNTIPQHQASTKSPNWLAHFAGRWQGEKLVREDQGNYESRDELK